MAAFSFYTTELATRTLNPIKFDSYKWSPFFVLVGCTRSSVVVSSESLFHFKKIYSDTLCTELALAITGECVVVIGHLPPDS